MQLLAIYESMKDAKYWGEAGPNKTVARYIDQLCTYFSGVEVHEVSYPRLKEFVAHLRTVSKKGQRLSGGTVNRYLAFVSLLFGEAAKHLPDFRPPAIPREAENTKYRQQTLSDDDVAALLQHMKNDVDRCIFEIMHRTGCRVGEILGRHEPGRPRELRLLPEHIDNEGYVELVDTKNGDDRTILVEPPELALQLRGHVERGELPRYETFRNRARKAAKAAGVAIPPRMLHSLRHKFCTQTATDDIPVDISMAAAGHKTYQTHMRYRRLSKEVQRRGARRVVELMRK